MQGGVLGNGVKLAYSAASPVNWVEVGQLMDFPDFPQLEAAIINTTVHSTSQMERGMPGMVPIAEMPFKVLADLDQVTGADLEAIRQYAPASGHANQGATLYWRIEGPTNRAQTAYRGVEFRAWVRGFKVHTPINDVQTVDIGLVFDDTVPPTWYDAGASQI